MDGGRKTDKQQEGDSTREVEINDNAKRKKRSAQQRRNLEVFETSIDNKNQMGEAGKANAANKKPFCESLGAALK